MAEAVWTERMFKGDREMKEKFILDPCCGPRYMWVNKNHPNVIYGDIRREQKGFSKYDLSVSIEPDKIMDFTQLPYDDESFKLVVFDPPHYVGNTDYCLMTNKFGILPTDTWRTTLKKGFDECWRVLEEYGVLIFKWNDWRKKYTEILKIIGKEPLFHHRQTGKGKTSSYWACFMKLPSEQMKVNCTRTGDNDARM